MTALSAGAEVAVGGGAEVPWSPAAPEVGIGYRRRAVAVEYRYSARGREYDAQPSAHAYGSLAVTVHGF